ncbi:MAG: Folate-binding protein YgfZ [Pseudomonadota bacterium]
MSSSEENKFIVLDKTSTIKVEGDDRIQFLQGQLTQDINLISENNALYAGFCNPKGRLLAFILCYRNNDSIHLQIDHSIKESILKKLKMYVLRSKVSLKLLDKMYVLRSKVSLKLLEDAFISVGFMGGKVFAGGKIKTPKNHLDIVKYHDIMIIRIGQKDGRYQLMGEASKVREFIKLNFSSYSTMSLDDLHSTIFKFGFDRRY